MGKAILAVFILLVIDFVTAYLLGRRSRSSQVSPAGDVPPPADLIDEIEHEVEERVNGKADRKRVLDIIAGIRERNGIERRADRDI